MRCFSLKNRRRNDFNRYNGVNMNITHIMPGALRLASIPLLSPEAKQRLKWFDYHRKCQNVAKTCRYFGIPRKTFYYWQKRYNKWRLESLEARDTAPKAKRQREITAVQRERVVSLRKQYIRYGKEKLAIKYRELFQEKISSWKIQKIIEASGLYYNPKRADRIRKKRRRTGRRKRIYELKRKNIPGFLICIDTVIIYWHGIKRYVYTAIDSVSKIAWARMYTTKSSYSARDFLYRLYYLLDGKIANIQTDNGSEFEGYFNQALKQLDRERYYSRVKTPKDNSINERFNRTLKDEFINLGNFTINPMLFNQKLTDWLIEYNFRRPHQTLAYLPPINYQTKYLRVLPMYPSSTNPCINLLIML